MPRMITLLISMLFYAIIAVQGTAFAQQTEPPKPTELEKVEEKVEEDAAEEKGDEKAKTRGFDPCLVNPKLPVCKTKP